MNEQPPKTRAEEVLLCVEILAESFRQKITPLTVRAYELGLSDIDINTIKRAVMVAIRDCKFMPTVHELRKLCGAAESRIETKDRPLLAWQAVREAIRRVGAYDSPHFEDVVIHAVIRELGGWPHVCDTETEQMQWLEKRFVAAYSAMSALKLPADQTARLAGLTEIDNSRSGYRSQEVRVVDVRCLSVVSEMTQPTALRLEQPQEVIAEQASSPRRLDAGNSATRRLAHAMSLHENEASLRETPV